MIILHISYKYHLFGKTNYPIHIQNWFWEHSYFCTFALFFLSAFSSFQKMFILFYLKSNKRQKQKVFQMLVHSSNASDREGWARPKSGVWIQSVSLSPIWDLWAARVQALEPSSVFSLDALQGIWIGSRVFGTQIGTLIKDAGFPRGGVNHHTTHAGSIPIFPFFCVRLFLFCL